MYLPTRGCATRRLLTWMLLLASGGWGGGCVSLDKPKNVEECSQSPLGCSDNPSPDAALDAADLRPSDEPGRDVVHDIGPATPEAGNDSVDVPSLPDIADQRPSDPGTGSDGKDLPSDKMNSTEPGAEPGPEPGKEPGVEPSAEPGPEPGPEPGKEPGAEPGSEPGPEPGPEPGKEPGPEPGPEPRPEPGPDGGNGPSCASTTPLTGGQFTFNTLGALCFVTCDAIQNGWGCSSFDATQRTVKVNGTSVTCGGTLPAKKAPGYYYFEIGAGPHTFDAIWWTGPNATSCTAPTGGFVP